MSASDLQRKLDAERYARLQGGMARVRAGLGNLIDPIKHPVYRKLWKESMEIEIRHGGKAPIV